MPLKSSKQYKFMAGIAHGMKSKKLGAPSPEVAEKLVHETSAKSRSQFMRGKRK